MELNSLPGGAFLHARDPQFHTSQEVTFVTSYLRENGERFPNEPSAKLRAYLGFMAHESYVNDGILTGDNASTARQIEAKVLHAEDVPESYFELYERIEFERGRGSLKLEDEEKEVMAKYIESSHRLSLLKWADHLTDSRNNYPAWFRWYAYHGVTQLGNYDLETQTFRRRSRTTTAAYPELHEAAVRKVYTWLDTTIITPNAASEEETEQESTLKESLRAGNFGKLYGIALAQSIGDNGGEATAHDGHWQRYEKGSLGVLLHKDLQGHAAPWCIAKFQRDAMRLLDVSDIDVYYTSGPDSTTRYPRIAIRTSPSGVEEVRGMLQEQQVEQSLLDVVNEKLETLPGGNLFQTRVDHMKRVTELYNKILADPQQTLTTDQIRFIYEIDEDIASFGFGADPRIATLRELRGGMDREAISALLPEQLHSQWYLSYQGYQSVCDDLILNGIAKSEAWEVAANQFHKSCKAQIASWQDNGTIDYMAQHIANYGGQFLLVAGPRRDLTYNQLLQLVCVFNQHALASGAEIAQQLYIEPLKKVTYRPPVQENLVQLTLLPLRGIPVAANVDESDHLSYVERMRLQRSGANLRVPSLSEAIYYWHSLAAHNLINEKTQDEIEALSFIWHFDLAPKQAKDYYSVQSLLGNERNARLQYQGMPEQDFIRLAVG